MRAPGDVSGGSGEGRRDPAPESALDPALEHALDQALEGMAPDGVVLEDRGLVLARAVGVAVPEHRVVAGAEDVDADLLSGFPGGKVVLKVLSPGIPHRARVGGVRVVPLEVEAVRTVLAGWAERFAREAPRFILEAHHPEAAARGELLLGYRDTLEFGPVVTLAPGGGEAEALAEGLWREAGPILLSASLLASAGSHGDELLVRLLDERRILARRLGSGGGEPSGDGLLALLRGMARLALAGTARGLTEFEVNPLCPHEGGFLALDALGRMGAGEQRDAGEPGAHPAVEAPARSLDPLFRPASLAIAGVSARGMNPGRIILRNVLAAGFPRDAVRVIKDGEAAVDGVPCVPSVSALEDPVDLLVLGVAAGEVPALVEEAVSSGRARSFILISGGMEEGLDPTAHTPADRVREALAGVDRTLPAVGSNCLGIRSVPGRFDTLFIPAWKLGFPDVPPAPVALISQSGAFAIARAAGAPGVNPRYLATLGTQLDVTVGEVLEHLLRDPELETAACYVEGFRAGDGLRFLAAARRWRDEGRRVVLYRGGRSQAGRDAAASHTAAVAGDYAVTRELCREAGVEVMETVEAFHDRFVLAALLAGRDPRGSREPGGSPGSRSRRFGVAALSNAGFECVSLGDHAPPLSFASLTPSTVARVRGILEEARLDEIVAVRNPLDVTPILGDGGFVEAARALLADPGVEAGVVSCVPLTPALTTLAPSPDHGEDFRAPEAMAAGLIRLWGETRLPWVMALDGGSRYDPLARHLGEAGIPVFPTADRAVRALGAWLTGAGGP